MLRFVVVCLSIHMLTVQAASSQEIPTVPRDEKQEKEIAALCQEIDVWREKIAADVAVLNNLDDAALVKLHREDKDHRRRKRAYEALVKRIVVGTSKTKVKEFFGEPKTVEGDDYLYSATLSGVLDLKEPIYIEVLRVSFKNDAVTGVVTEKHSLSGEK